MALTTRKDIINQMIYILEQLDYIITVTRWRDTDAEPFDPEECPALNIKDGNAPITHNVSNDEHALSVTLDIHSTSRVSADEIESLLGDLAEKITANDTWGGYSDGSSIDSHNINITHTGDIITSGTLEITVIYTTDRGKL